MRYKRMLNDEQIKYLLANAHLPNSLLAEELKVKTNLIGVYKYRARKAGLNIPKGSREKMADKMRRIAKTI